MSYESKPPTAIHNSGSPPKSVKAERGCQLLFSSMNLGPSALQRTSALLRNSASLCRRSIAGRAALPARQRCPASRWRVVLGIPTPTVGLLLVPAGTVFRLVFLASLRDALVWPVPVPGVPLGKGGLALPPANLLPSLRDGWTASRRDAGILAGGRGRVFCGRHPRRPSPQKFTRTPAGARGKPRGANQPPLAGPRPAFIGTH